MVRNAFTMLEVMLVVGILALVAAITWPDFHQAQRSEELDESARRMKTLIQMCRAQAMNETRRYRLLFYEDGAIDLKRQRDPILAPQEYFRFREPWANISILMDRVWVESIKPLPEGPPPMDIEDDLIEFEDDYDDEPIEINDLEAPFSLDFEPDGLSPCLKWTLRDESGRGILMTLDGRLGRVSIEPVERLDDEPRRPDPLERDEDDLEFEQDQAELEDELPT